MGLIVNRYSRRPSRGDCKGASEILPYVKIPLVANAHPFQVDPGIGFLRTLEGFGFVSGWCFPDNSFVGSRPVLSSRAWSAHSNETAKPTVPTPCEWTCDDVACYQLVSCLQLARAERHTPDVPRLTLTLESGDQP